jgi:cobalt-zinc-cadmium efflux system outer membrane protein
VKNARRLLRTGATMLITASVAGAAQASAQRPVTLAEAITAAERSAPSLAVTRADSMGARADLALARAFPNPLLSPGYSRSVPRFHLELEQPFDYPWVRAPRIRAAEIASSATGLLTAAERASVRYRVEVAYAQAAGVAAVAELSRQNVLTGEELVRSVQARHAAGDVSELDVELARVTLGQLRSAALTDSLAAIETILSLQSLMGLPTDRVEITPADSLTAVVSPPVAAPAAFRVTAAERRLAAAQTRLLATRRGRLPAPSLRVGFERGDPSEPGLLPTLGVSLPLPLWNSGRAEVEQARAMEARAEAELASLRRETNLAVAAAQRQRSIAFARIEVDRTTVASAQRVATLSLTAYREGAYPVATVLEAQRSVREALRGYQEDLMLHWTAEAAYRLVTTAGGATP